ncbi:MAG: glycosyltransferase family 4 protein [Candidatus Auribacterota bacterium]
MKIVLLPSNFSPDMTGIANTASRLYRWLKEKGHNVSVVTFTARYYKDADIPEWARGNDIYRYCPSLRRGKIASLLDSIKLAVIIWRTCRNADIIMTMGWSLLNIGLRISLVCMGRKKIVMAFRGNDGWKYDSSARINLRKWFAMRSHVITNSSALKYHLERKSIPVQDVIWSEADFELFDRSLNKPEPNHVVMVKGLYPVGGADVALEAVHELCKRGVKVRMTFAGDGPLREELTERARKYGISDCVRFKGSVAHHRVPDLLARAEVFVLSSNLESSPHVVAEAMAMAKPVAATATDGTAEFIKHGLTGMLSPVGDHKALADNIEYLLRNKKEASAMAENAWQFAKNKLSLDCCFNQYQEIFDRLHEKNERDNLSH